MLLLQIDRTTDPPIHGAHEKPTAEAIPHQCFLRMHFSCAVPETEASHALFARSWWSRRL